MIIVALVATLAGSMVWQQWRAIQVEAAERARTQSAWILSGALDWARLILREDAQATAARRPPRRAVGGAARRSAPVDLPRRRQGQHRRRARTRSCPARSPTRRRATTSSTSSTRRPGRPDSSWRRCERLCETVGVSADVAARIAAGHARRRRRSRRRVGAGGAAQRPRRERAVAAPPTRRCMPRSARQLAWLGIDPPNRCALLEPYVVHPAASADAASTSTRRRARCSSPRSPASTSRPPSASSSRASATPFKTHRRRRARCARRCRRRASTRLASAPSFFEVRGRLRLGDVVLEQRSLVQRRGLDVVVLQRERVSSREQAGS